MHGWVIHKVLKDYQKLRPTEGEQATLHYLALDSIAREIYKSYFGPSGLHLQANKTKAVVNIRPADKSVHRHFTLLC